MTELREPMTEVLRPRNSGHTILLSTNTVADFACRDCGRTVNEESALRPGIFQGTVATRSDGRFAERRDKPPPDEFGMRAFHVAQLWSKEMSFPNR